LEQIAGDLEQLRGLGAEVVILDPFNGDLDEIRHPEGAWRALAAVAGLRTGQTPDIETERSGQ
ncbi:MAG: LLM class F420-dependent oxidoreductase, partial [Streptosporangiaceae bacterium]